MRAPRVPLDARPMSNPLDNVALCFASTSLLIGAGLLHDCGFQLGCDPNRKDHRWGSVSFTWSDGIVVCHEKPGGMEQSTRTVTGEVVTDENSSGRG